MASHRFTARKGRDTSLLLSDNWENSPLVLYQNSATGSFLRLVDSCYLKLFILLYENLYICLILCVFDVCMIIQHTLVIWKLLVHWVIKIFQTLVLFIIQYKKTFIDFPTNVSPRAADTNFLKIIIFTWNFNFFIGNKYCKLFALSDRFSSLICDEISAKLLKAKWP